MILATHAVAGSFVANLMPHHPVLGFFAGFGSHFLLDAIPHWHYRVGTIQHDFKNRLRDDMVIDKNFPIDLSKIALDAGLGIFLSLLFFGPFHISFTTLSSITFLGAIGGILPDALQFVYWKWRHEPLISLQRFHLFIHAKTNLDKQHVLGITLQALLVAAFIIGGVLK